MMVKTRKRSIKGKETKNVDEAVNKSLDKQVMLDHDSELLKNQI
jgi:hypothetical protein